MAHTLTTEKTPSTANNYVYKKIMLHIRCALSQVSLRRKKCLCYAADSSSDNPYQLIVFCEC